MALVIDGADGESGLRDMDGGELDEPAGLAGESVDDGDDAGDFGRGSDPPLREQLESSGVGNVLGRVTH